MKSRDFLEFNDMSITFRAGYDSSVYFERTGNVYDVGFGHLSATYGIWAFSLWN